MAKKRVLITGASGGLGAALYQHWQAQYEVLGLCFQHPAPGLHPLDLRQPEPIAELLQRFQPDQIVHTVALTDVDRCERDLLAALDTNVRCTLHLRLAAEALNCPVLHVSTNDVFGGQQGYYRESDRPQPLNMYAKTKQMAEEMWSGYAPCLILRFTLLSWYAAGKTTFASWLCRSLQAGQPVTLSVDQFYSPLHPSTLAQWLASLFGESGLLHLGSERVSRWQTGLALAQALQLNTELIQPGSAQDLLWQAPRPLDVSLDCSLAAERYGLRSTLVAEMDKLVAEAKPA